MMKIIFLVMLPLAWSYGEPNSQGGGAFAYVDSSGNRYGGTYGLKDGKVVSRTGDAIPQHFADYIPHPQHFADYIPYPQNFADYIPYPQHFADIAYQGEDDIGQNYYANLENLLQEVFNKNIGNQRLAFNAARKAFDLTSNQAGGGYPGSYSGGYSDGYSGGDYPNPNIAFRSPAFPSLPGFTMPRPNTNFGNGAFASAHAGPGYQHHVASIYPSNPGNPNVNHFSDASAPANGGFYSVSSKSYSSASNVNGKESSNRGAETYVNANGKITYHKVQS